MSRVKCAFQWGGLAALMAFLLLCAVYWGCRRRRLQAEWMSLRTTGRARLARPMQERKRPHSQGGEASTEWTIADAREELERLDDEMEYLHERMEKLDKQEEAEADESGPEDMAQLRKENPELYENWRHEIACDLHYAMRLRELREAYLQRLDLTLLTEEERQEFRALVADVEAEEARFLRGERVAGDEFDTMDSEIRNMREARRTMLALIADREQWGGTAIYGDVLRTFLDLELSSATEVFGRGPGAIRGDFWVLTEEVDEATGEKRPVRLNVKVEPGWRPEEEADE